MSFEPTPTDISAMSPTEATAKLAEMTATANPPPPLAPATAADARCRLDVLTNDKTFADRLFSNDAEARREFAELSAKAAEADVVGEAIAGTTPPWRPFETTVDGAWPRPVVNNRALPLECL